MVGVDLHHGEKSRQRTAKQKSTAIAKDYACYCRRNIGEGDEFPNVPRTDDDDEIT